MLGPFDLEFDPEAAMGFSDGKPTSEEEDCMSQFVDSLQKRGSAVPHKELGDVFAVTETCGYLIHIRFLNEKKTKARIEKIYRPGIGRFRQV